MTTLDDNRSIVRRLNELTRCRDGHLWWNAYLEHLNGGPLKHPVNDDRLIVLDDGRTFAHLARWSSTIQWEYIGTLRPCVPSTRRGTPVVRVQTPTSTV